MHPTIFEIPLPEFLRNYFASPSLVLHSYGALIVLGFFVGVWLLRKKARHEHINPETVTDIAFWALVMGLVGGRVLYIITRWDAEFADNPAKVLRFWEGGLVYYGGFIAGVATFLVLSKKYKLKPIQITDMAAPSLAIAHAFGRFGCFAAGCCFGRKIDPDHPFAVIFNHPQTVAPMGIPIHPAQLYDAANALIVFTIMEVVYRRRHFTGQVTAIYLMLYALGRAIVEGYRGDSIRGFVIEDVLSTSQFISIFIFLAGIFVWRKFRRVPR